jgi:hypothetical protein
LASRATSAHAHTALTGDYDEHRVAKETAGHHQLLQDVNRVVFWAGSKGSIDEFRVEPTRTSREGLDVLREADARVRDILAEYDTQKRIWQCPVVMLPLKRRGESTIAIRPVESHDGMTAQYSKLPWPVIERITNAVLDVPGVGALLYDVTNKPPATISGNEGAWAGRSLTKNVKVGSSPCPAGPITSMTWLRQRHPEDVVRGSRSVLWYELVITSPDGSFVSSATPNAEACCVGSTSCCARGRQGWKNSSRDRCVRR